MTNAEDKKNIIVVVLILIIMLGVLFFAKSCNRQEFYTDEDKQNVTDSNTNNNQDTDIKDNDQQTGSTNTNSKPATNKTEINYTPVVKEEILDDEQIETDIPTEDIEEKMEAPVISILDSYTVSINDASFLLPDVSGVDGKGIPYTVNMTYSFRSLYDLEYRPTDSFTTSILGSYKIVYIVTNSDLVSSMKEITVDVVDNESPVIEAIIEEYDPESGLTSFIPVATNSIVNKLVKFTFSDNDMVSYAEYYKAKYENIGGEDTIEQEALQDIIPIDLQQELTLNEDGEYHVRAYDESGNVTEYIVTIDFTNPVFDVTYTKTNGSTIVTITSNEEIKPVEGFELSEDKKVLTKTIQEMAHLDVKITDLAGNEVTLPLDIEVEKTILEVLQNGNVTTSSALNTNDGDITLRVISNVPYTITYKINGLGDYTYAGEKLTLNGYYEISVVSNGVVVQTDEFDISNVVVGD